LTLFLLAAGVTRLVRKTQAPRFETLEECEKAYADLLGVPIKAIPEWEDKPAVVNTPKPATTPAPTTLKPLAPKEVGAPEKKEAKPAYFPPVSGTGEPDKTKGWDYVEHGDDWGDSCKGERQSPVDIVRYVDIGGQTKSVLWFDYYADPKFDGTAELQNDGHSIFFDQPHLDLGYVKIGNAEYEATDYVFHAPSEHTIDGQVYPLEMQIMHKAGDQVLAISILFKYGESNAFLAALETEAAEMPKWTVEHHGAKVELTSDNKDLFNLENVIPKSKIHPGGDLTFYSYPGSLTSPPCTGGVDWWVSASPIDASTSEIKKIRDAIIGAEPTPRGNNRDTQELGDRKVLVGHTGFQHHIKQTGHNDEASNTPHPRGYNTQDAPWVAKGEAVEETAE